MLIVERFQASFEDIDTVTRSASSPFAWYLSDRLEVDEEGRWVPTDEALEVVDTFLEFGETYAWLDPEDRVLIAGPRLGVHVKTGSVWSLCDSPEYCEVSLDEGQIRGGSTWTKLALKGEHIGTFLLIWFESPVLSALGQRRLQAELLSRLVAAAALATFMSLLLVSLVTRRLSRLASEAATPLGEDTERFDLPGPFEVRGDDEIAQLASALNTMRSRIEELMGRLAERDRQRREWIAQVSHDLRTPLTALSACLDRAGSRLSESPGFAQRGSLEEAITVARQDTDRVQTLVDGLFELARLDAGESLFLEPVPPGELVRQAVGGLRPMAEAQGIALRAVIAPSLPIIQADGRRLMRALENLIRNAIHFAEERVEVAATCEGAYLQFQVRDDGPGLPEKSGEVLFAQTDDQPRRPDSAGIGLIVTRRVAIAHGGSIGGANPPTGGAQVWIKIPLTPRG
jgi:signal transduction histidine kinase